jgi:hypothetical protein
VKIRNVFFLSTLCSLFLPACTQSAPMPAAKPAEVRKEISKPAPPASTSTPNQTSAKETKSMIDLDNPPRGPAIPAGELKKQILALVASLQSQEDTNQVNVEKHMGVKMYIDPEWDLNRMYWGQTTEGWKYWFSVTKLRKEPASSIEFYLFHDEEIIDDALPKTCTLHFENLAKEMVAMGYERGERPFRRRWGFGKDIDINNLGIGIGIKVYQVDNGTEDGLDCVESIHIGSGTLNE